MTMTDTIKKLRADPAYAGLHRSLDVYHLDPWHMAGLEAIYAPFLRQGDLAFDIGSHVGDRIEAFRRCGAAKVVALEPQPGCARVIRQIFAGDAKVHLIEAACGPQPGSLTLHVNSANPTVTTASPDFIKAADGAKGWEGQVWDREITVPVTTLDQLIAEHGRPAFVKIDVEGFEADVLAGLSQAVPVLSFEFTTIQRDVAYTCLEMIDRLGRYRYSFMLGDVGGPDRIGEGIIDGKSRASWRSREQVAAHIATLPHAANSGDVYAWLDE
jgi:FkbM family methyltransferase